MTEAEKDTAKELVEANAANLQAVVGEVKFANTLEELQEVVTW